ncbi:branched-chain amino acid ABC transporter permease [Faunimonas sp. B44]|uniref:branched-chain amino acid ABC transporter permease n=1 Tax=Faunimonas sp. B44 TaxID=3461493 RepID=UPI004044B800
MSRPAEGAGAARPAAAQADRGAARPFLARNLVPLLLFAGLLVLPWLASALGQSFLVSFATRVMIYALAAMSLDLILGYGAMVSFGHAAFIGIGAYAIGIASDEGLGEGLLAFPLAVGAASLFALVTGAVSLRTRGVYFIMITLAFGQMAFFTAMSLSAYGGDDGLTIWGRSEIFGARWLRSNRSFYFFVLGLLAASYLVCRAIVASRFGRVLQAARQSPSRVAALGFNPYAYQLVAYVIAGGLAGLAGALLANQTEFVSPAYMSWHRSGDLIVMVILGGMGSLHGAILGAIVYLGLEEALSHVTEHWRLVFGPFLVAVVLFARGGLLSFLPGRYRNG